jgi:hypothetical protein
MNIAIFLALVLLNLSLVSIAGSLARVANVNDAWFKGNSPEVDQDSPVEEAKAA